MLSGKKAGLSGSLLRVLCDQGNPEVEKMLTVARLAGYRCMANQRPVGGRVVVYPTGNGGTEIAIVGTSPEGSGGGSRGGGQRDDGEDAGRGGGGGGKGRGKGEPVGPTRPVSASRILLRP